MLVHSWVVQTPVDPIDEEVGEDEEDWYLKEVVSAEWRVGEGVVHFAVAPDFKCEERDGEDGHDRHGEQCLAHFENDLVLEVFRVLECGVVKDEEVG